MRDGKEDRQLDREVIGDEPIAVWRAGGEACGMSRSYICSLGTGETRGILQGWESGSKAASRGLLNCSSLRHRIQCRRSEADQGR